MPSQQVLTPGSDGALPRDPTVMDLSDIDGDPGITTPPDGQDPAPPRSDDDDPDHNDIAIEESTLSAAREMGWAPKDKWKGDPEQWVDADTFVRRGNVVLPIVRKRLDESQAENRLLREKIAQMETSFGEVKSWLKEQNDQKLLRAKGLLKDERREALEAQNFDRVNEIDIELMEMRAAPAAPEKRQSQQPDPATVELFRDFATDNPWITRDKELQVAMSIEAKLVREAGTDLVGRPFLEFVKRRVVKQFPEKFSRGNGSANLAEGDGSHGGGGNSRRSYANLKADRKAVCDRWVKDGTLTQKEFVANCEPDDFRS